MNFRLILTWIVMLAGPVIAADPPPAPEPATASAEAPPPMQALPQRAETLRSKALAKQIQQVDKETDIVWLASGEEEFLGLYRADHSGKTFANILILHDNQQHPDWPGIVKTLRRDLAAHGWNTLAIGLPDYQVEPEIPAPASEPVAPAAEPATPPAANTKPEAAKPAPAKTAPEPVPTPTPALAAEAKPVEYPPEQVPDIVDSRTREGVAFLQQKDNLPLVVVAVGLSATFAAKKAQTMLISDIAGLVIIDPVEPASLDFKINMDAMDLRIPVLDIAPEFMPRSNPALRQQSARRARHDMYEQRIMRGATPDFPNFEPAVIKAVRGWGERWLKQQG